MNIIIRDQLIIKSFVKTKIKGKALISIVTKYFLQKPIISRYIDTIRENIPKYFKIDQQETPEYIMCLEW